MIISIVGVKGGVGKTTLAISLAAEWLDRGQEVLVVETGSQRSVRDWARRAEAGGCPAPTVLDWDADSGRWDQLRAEAAHYDRVLVDCAAHERGLQEAALLSCDVALMPCGLTPLDVWGLVETTQIVNRVAEIRPELNSHILVCRRLSRTTLNRAMIEVLEGLGIRRLDTVVGHRVDYQRAPALGLGVTSAAPNSRAADEIRALADEVDALGSQAVRLRPPVQAYEPAPRPDVQPHDYKAWQEQERLTVYEPVNSYC